MIIQPFRSDPQKVYGAEAFELGAKLAALVEGIVIHPNGRVEASEAIEAAVAKAGFRQDSVGQWFYGAKPGEGDKPGTRGVHVPTPMRLQPDMIKTSGLRQTF